MSKVKKQIYQQYMKGFGVWVECDTGTCWWGGPLRFYPKEDVPGLLDCLADWQDCLGVRSATICEVTLPPPKDWEEGEDKYADLTSDTKTTT